MKIAVLDDYLKIARELADWSQLPAGSELTVFHEPIGDEDALAAALEPFEIVCLMRERTPFGAGLISRLPNLKLIVTTGGRNYSIDIGAANARGVVVSGTRGKGHPAAELAFAHVLALSRGIVQEALSMREGGWQVAPGRNLQGATLGLMGLGGLGRTVARYGAAFEMDVIAWSQNLTAETAAESGAALVTKEQLLARSDYLVVLLRLSERTVGIVGAAEIALMKPTACLINISRGPIVDADAMADALRAGRIAGGGLDVYDVEPLPASSPLRQVPNLLLTPHIGYATADSFEVFYPQTLESVLAFLDGSPIRVMDPSAGSGQ